MDVQKLREELEQEIRGLELERVRIEERLAEKQRTLARLGASDGVGNLVRHSIGLVHSRKSITALGSHHYEVNGSRFENSGQLLDHFNVPHYFSKKNPGKDGAQREILRWAKGHPGLARTVSVVLANGIRTDLHMAVLTISP